LKSVPGRGANKTQIVYEFSLNFHTVVPYLELITRNGLAERIEGGVTRYKTTAKGEEALRCMRAGKADAGTHAAALRGSRLVLDNNLVIACRKERLD
jgi:hypothetical protein